MTSALSPSGEVLVLVAGLLGWAGTVHWPVIASGVRMAVVRSEEWEWHRGPGGGWLVGCIVPGATRATVAAASLWAGYLPRAVLMPEELDMLGIQVDAAILDVGLVCGWQQPRLLAAAGPVVPSALTRTATTDARWDRLVHSVLGAPTVEPPQHQRTITTRCSARWGVGRKLT